MTYNRLFCQFLSLFLVLFFCLGAQESLAARGNAGWTMVSNNGTDKTCGGTSSNVSANASQWNNDTPVNADNISLILTHKSTGAVVGSYNGISQAGPGCSNTCTDFLNIDVAGGSYSDFKGTYDYTTTCGGSKSVRLQEKVYLKEKSLGNDYQAISPISGDWLNYDPEFKIELVDFPASITTGGVTILNNSIRSIALTDSLNGAPPVIFTRSFSGGKGIYTFPKQNLANGEHLWSFYVFMGTAVNQIISGRTPSLWTGVDMLPPVIDSYDITPAAPDEDSDVTLTVKATDNLSGLESLSVYLDGELKDTCNFAVSRDQQTCAVNVGRLGMGSHDFKIVATDHTKNPAGESSGNTIIVNKNISIPDTIAPIAAIINPLDGAVFAAEQTVLITATSTDNVGVDRVEFYDGSTLLGAIATTSLPYYGYSWPINAASNGTHSLYVKAYDAAGNSATSTAVGVTVNIFAADTPPAVIMVSPPNNETFASAQTVIVSASSTDNIGVVKVDFYDNAVLLGTATSTTNYYSIDWPIGSGNNGAHSLSARSYDTAGNSTDSAAIAITVNIPVTDSELPKVEMIAPTSGISFTSAQTVTVAASSTDNVGVREVKFYFKKDGGSETMLGTATSTTNYYGINWPVSSADNGNYSFYAKAYDNAGNSATSAAIAVTVDINGNKPSVVPKEPNQPNSCLILFPPVIFSWDYYPAGGGLPQSVYEIQIIKSGGNFNSPLVDFTSSSGATDTSWAANPPDKLEFGSIYEWRIRVTDSDNKKSNWEPGADFATPAHAYPMPSFTFIPKTNFVGVPVKFTDTSTGFGGIQSRAWTFENGTTTDYTVPNPIVNFSVKGNNKVTLEVVDSDGHMCKIEKNLYVSRRLPEWKEVGQ